MNKEHVGSFNGPATVDLLITGNCQMDCVCFRPRDNVSQGNIDLEGWKKIIYLCHSVGTQNVVLSGGEPLLFEDLPTLLKYTKSLGLRITLSTNALLFGKLHQDIMPHVDDIGIPLDGPTPEINALMRSPAELNQFQRAIEAIQIVQRRYPSVELTVRTVVSAVNKDAVKLIPKLLERKGIKQASYRWKLYQFNPAVSETLKCRVEQLLLPTEDFLSVWRSIQEEYTGLPHWFSFFPVIAAEENNFLVYPNGEAAILKEMTQTQDKHNLLPRLQYVRLGNLATEFDETMATWSQMVK